MEDLRSCYTMPGVLQTSGCTSKIKEPFQSEEVKGGDEVAEEVMQEFWARAKAVQHTEKEDKEWGLIPITPGLDNTKLCAKIDRSWKPPARANNLGIIWSFYKRQWGRKYDDRKSKEESWLTNIVLPVAIDHNRRRESRRNKNDGMFSRKELFHLFEKLRFISWLKEDCHRTCQVNTVPMVNK